MIILDTCYGFLTRADTASEQLY